jgi:hypothetical protein
LIAFPGDQTGTLDIRLASEFISAEALFRRCLSEQGCRRADLLFGYRFARFDENLLIDGSSTFIREIEPLPVGTIIQTTDSFDTLNEFHGAEVGISTRAQYCRLSVELLAKLALGYTQSRVLIDGSTVRTIPPDPPAPSPGGFLALPTNMGTFEQRSFSVMPELGMTLGYYLTPRLRVTAGYTFLYWSRVTRPGDQVDLNVNSTQFPPGQLEGFSAPQFRNITTDFWLQGLSLGFDYRF